MLLTASCCFHIILYKCRKNFSSVSVTIDFPRLLYIFMLNGVLSSKYLFLEILGGCKNVLLPTIFLEKMSLRHIDRLSWRSGLLRKYNSSPMFSTYNPTDRKYPPDIMEKFLENLSKYGSGSIFVEKDNSSGVAVVTIENHKRRNALTGHMMVALKGVVNELEEWGAGKAVILRGHGDTFCSGGDLKAVMKEIGTPEEGRMMCEYMQETLTRFMELPLISVAALNGKSLGGGAEVSALHFITS